MDCFRPLWSVRAPLHIAILGRSLLAMPASLSIEVSWGIQHSSG
jgi:hypothetical protein